MKIINFTAKEILPALLDRTKTQTIRPAWKEIEGNKEYSDDTFGGFGVNKVNVSRMVRVRNNEKKIIEKPARFKVGEKAKLIWNQRSKYNYFCRSCGKEEKGIFRNSNCCNDFHFPKWIGNVEITKVKKITMLRKIIVNSSLYEDLINDVPTYIHLLSDGLALKDGFQSPNEMFDWFHKKYDLSIPKPFWVYRWKWH